MRTLLQVRLDLIDQLSMKWFSFESRFCQICVNNGKFRIYFLPDHIERDTTASLWSAASTLFSQACALSSLDRAYSERIVIPMLSMTSRYDDTSKNAVSRLIEPFSIAVFSSFPWHNDLQVVRTIPAHSPIDDDYINRNSRTDTYVNVNLSISLWVQLTSVGGRSDTTCHFISGEIDCVEVNTLRRKKN